MREHYITDAQRLECCIPTFDQNNTPNKELDPLLNPFPKDRTGENKPAHWEGLGLVIWKHFDTTRITKYQNGLLRGARESSPSEDFQTGQIVYLICLRRLKISTE